MMKKIRTKNINPFLLFQIMRKKLQILQCTACKHIKTHRKVICLTLYRTQQETYTFYQSQVSQSFSSTLNKQKIRNPKVIWEVDELPLVCYIAIPYSQNLPLSVGGTGPSSNTLFLGPTRIHQLNDISIVIKKQLLPMDRWSDRIKMELTYTSAPTGHL